MTERLTVELFFIPLVILLLLLIILLVLCWILRRSRNSMFGQMLTQQTYMGTARAPGDLTYDPNYTADDSANLSKMAPVTRNFTELKLSVGGISHVLTIRTEQGHADQLMDRMLDRVFLQVKADPGDKLGVEPRAEPEEELAAASGSDPEDSTTSLPSRAVNVQNMGMWKWTILRPPKAAPPPPPPPTPPPPPPPSVDQDQIDNLSTHQSNVPQHASLSSQGSSSSSSS